MKPLKSSAPVGHLLETSLSRVTVSCDGCVIVRKGNFKITEMPVLLSSYLYKLNLTFGKKLFFQTEHDNSIHWLNVTSIFLVFAQPVSDL